MHGSGSMGSVDSKDREEYMMQADVLRLARQSTLSRYGPSEDTLRQRKFEEFMKTRSSRSQSGYTDDTARTRVVDLDDENEKFAPKRMDRDEEECPKLSDRELGYREVRQSEYHDHEDRYSMAIPRNSGTWADGHPTLVGWASGDKDLPSPDLGGRETDILVDDSRLRDSYPPSPTHAHTPSTEAASVAVPLLAHTRHDSHDSTGASVKVPLGGASSSRPPSHARVGSFGSGNGETDNTR